MKDYTKTTLGELLSSKNRTIRNHALGIVKAITDKQLGGANENPDNMPDCLVCSRKLPHEEGEACERAEDKEYDWDWVHR